MKYLTFSIIFLLLLGAIKAQDLYAYDWHQKLGGKPMLKFSVSEYGLYRITRQTISSYHPAFASVLADSLRLFFRGKEVPLHIHFRGNPTWQEMEFMGRRHDGGEDSLLYRNNIIGVPDPSGHTNDRISLFTDTAAYYLVASGIGTPRRWQGVSDFDYSRNPESSLNYTASLSFPPNDPNVSIYTVSGGSAYDSFNALNSDYILGEGYVSRASFGLGDPANFTFATPQPVPGQQQVAFAARVFGRSNTTHRLRLLEPGSRQAILDTSWNANQIYLKTYQRAYTTDLDNSFTLRCEALGTGSADNNHLVWVDLQYRRLPDMNGDSMIRFKDVPTGSLLRLTNCRGIDSLWAFSEITGQRFSGVVSGDTAWLDLAALNDTSDLFIVSDRAVKQPVFEVKQPKALCHPDSGAQMMMITHRSLEASARAYAAFRDSSLSVKVFFIDDIYEAFGYDTPTPLAIQRFCNCAIHHWNTSPEYLLIWGNAYPTIRHYPNDQIPTWGFPATDLAFTVPLNSLDYVPQIPVGRVSIITDSSGDNYLDKARIWVDTNRKDEWMLTGTFVGGGASVGERRAIRTGMDNVRQSYTNSAMRGSSGCSFSKPDIPIGIPRPDTCHYKAAGFRFHFGHSSSNISDSYLASPEFYDDSGTSSLVFVMGSYGGNFTIENIIAEQWLVYPDKGAVAWLGNTGPGYLAPLRTYSEIFMPLFADEMIEQPIGDVMKATIQKFKDSVPGIQTKNHTRQMNLLGDPSLVLSRRRYPASIESLARQNPFFIFPNPVQSQFTVYSKEKSLKTVSLLNIQGQVVQEWRWTPGTQEATFELLPSISKGYYLVALTTKTGRYASPLIISE